MALVEERSSSSDGKQLLTDCLNPYLNSVFLIFAFALKYCVLFFLAISVFKFVEPPENNEKPMDQKSTAKFKIMSLKVKGQTDYVHEMACLILIVFLVKLYFPKFIIN
ncbi:hypothetical protein SASPL_154187 [Salvia splendens]|uniref:Uncharacterized protein n=1 Tax=Salvia splendens TaxID=180675 RepID=A0A8X8VZQ9_SALSN|nr:hypothetical protein SASPL_154187 [Salvia splendens]